MCKSKRKPARQMDEALLHPIAPLDRVAESKCKCEGSEGCVSENRAELHPSDGAEARPIIHQVIHLINGDRRGERNESPNSKTHGPYQTGAHLEGTVRSGILFTCQANIASWPWNKFTTAIGASTLQIHGAGWAERALERTDIGFAILL